MQISEMQRNVGIEGMSFEGQIISVSNRKTGSGQYGPYSFQNILLADGNAKISASIRNRDEITSDMKGKWFSFSSTPDKNGKNKGVRIEEDKWKDKETSEEHSKIQVVITPSAKMVAVEKGKETTEKGKEPALKTTAEKETMTKEDWAEKDRRLARMASVKDEGLVLQAVASVLSAMLGQGMVGVEEGKIEEVMERVHKKLKEIGDRDRDEFEKYIVKGKGDDK